MSLTHEQVDRLHQGAAAVIDGTITAEVFSALALLLSQSEDARTLYAKNMYLQVSLTRLLREGGDRVRPPNADGTALADNTANAQADVPPGIADAAAPATSSAADSRPVPLPPPTDRHAVPEATKAVAAESSVVVTPPRAARVWGLTTRAKIAAALLVGLVFYGSFTAISWNIVDRREARGLREEAGGWRREAGGGQVATITGSEGARWLKKDAAAPNQKLEIRNQKPEILPGKTLSLASGTVELKLKQGVRLLVEGPARWSVAGDNRVKLDAGKLVATVPHEAIGFTVETPTTEIVDLGTEFGVTVDERGQTSTQVFRGEVRLDSAAAAGAAAPARIAPRSITLRAGQAIQITTTGQTRVIEPLAATPEQFIRPPAPAGDKELDPDILSPYAKYVIEQTKPVAYWDFSRFHDSMAIVNDRIAGHPFERFFPRHVGMLGPAANDGFPGFGAPNPALSQDAGTSVVQGLVYRSETIPTTGYTMALWIQPSGTFDQQPHYYVLGNGHAARVPNEGVRDSLMILGARDPSRMGRLGLFTGKAHEASSIPAGKTPLVSGKWHWVVLVREPEKVSVYLDGVPELEVASSGDGKPGALFSYGHRVDLFPTIPFQGQLDEAALWDRALGPEEILAMYHQATGQPVPSAGADE